MENKNGIRCFNCGTWISVIDFEPSDFKRTVKCENCGKKWLLFWENSTSGFVCLIAELVE